MRRRNNISVRVVQKSSPEDKKTRNLLIYQALIIAIIPVIGYAMAYIYEWAYCVHFGIPPEFISVSLTNVFITVGIIFAIIAFWSFGALLIYSVKTKYRSLDTKYSPLFPVTLIFLLLIIIIWGAWLFMAVIGVLYVVLISLMYIALSKSKQQVDTSQTKVEKDEASLRFDKIMKSVISIVGMRTIMVASVILGISSFLVSFSYIVGNANAIKQTDFLIPSTYQNAVVLRVYGDNIICAPFNRTTKIVQREFFIIKMGESSNITFKKENVGPLH